MKISNNFIVCLIALMIFSCGPKKGIVTKKKHDKDKTIEVAVSKDDAEKEVKTILEPVNSVDAYISRYASIAKSQMVTSKIPASITLAQGILESGSGRGRLAVEANNHFGIKCHGWKGAKIYHDDDRSQECFRKYDQPELSYRDHSEFLTGRKRYAKLFDLRPDDYKGWAKGLRSSGYATDKRYPQKLISLIERYELYRYDDEVLNGKELNRIRVNSGISFHIVEKGDTLYSLSKRYNTTVEAIKEMNNLNSNDLAVGQELKIPN